MQNGSVLALLAESRSVRLLATTVGADSIDDSFARMHGRPFPVDPLRLPH
jgi:hypothetical protein